MKNRISSECVRLEFIKQIICVDHVDLPNENLLIGVDEMDDAALIKISATESLVVASNFVRSSGFYLSEKSYLNYYNIGYYLVVASVRDIAAMGARPYYLTTVFRYQEEVTDKQFKDLFHRMKVASDLFEMAIIFLGINFAKLAVSASVDFELVFTMSPRKQELCRHLFQERGLQYTIIGEVNSLGRNVLLDQWGVQSELPEITWHHQSGDFLSQILEREGD